MTQLPDGRKAEFISESGAAAPTRLALADDTTRAGEALRRIQSGQVLLWKGDYVNGRQLLAALGRRVNKETRLPFADTLARRWRNERAATRERAELLGQVLVLIEATGKLTLRRAPDTQRAVELAWGPSDQPRLVGLSTLVGALSAAQWTEKKIEVPGLEGSIVPRFGVFSPTRRAYVDLLDNLEASERSVLDVGCGTGVLGFVMLQRGATRAVGTDMEERAVACATHNAEQLGLAESYSAVRADLFPESPQEERFDLVLFNAPWVPETPRTALDRAVFDEDGETLRRFLHGVSARLSEHGVAALLVSDLPERLGLRDPGELEELIAEANLQVEASHSVPASHHRARDTEDPLHEARGAELIQLFIMKSMGS
ncbi:MAG: polypeptide subunit release factor methylase [Planctomycetota bacterium]|jgi:methylase of polypeptide subunit release factors